MHFKEQNKYTGFSINQVFKNRAQPTTTAIISSTILIITIAIVIYKVVLFL